MVCFFQGLVRFDCIYYTIVASAAYMLGTELSRVWGRVG
jgi:hypothetical protein